VENWKINVIAINSLLCPFLISVKKKSKKKKVWNPKSNQITSPTLPLVMNYLTLSALKKNQTMPTFSSQNEKGYDFFCVFPFKKPAFQSVSVFPVNGGQRQKLRGDEYINIADLPCQNAI
jgi:hypothetical protein